MISLPPVPPGVDLSEDQSADVVASAIITWILAVTAVTLRIVSRRLKRVRLWIDDWFIIAALPAATTHGFTMDVFSISRGFARHIWAGPPDAEKIWALCVFIGELSYITCMVCVKLSILAFYWRLFRIRESIKVPIILLALIVSLWGVASSQQFLVTLLECQPIRAWWARFDPVDPLPPSKYTCGVNPSKFFLSIAIGTIATDILMLALPAPYIWTLRLPRVQKFTVCGIFLVGLFVTAVSFVRLTYVLNGFLEDPDNTWTFIGIAIWSVVELNTTIICACLPLLRPVLRKLRCWPRRRQQSSSAASENTTSRLRPWEYQGDRRISQSPAYRMQVAGGLVEEDEDPFSCLVDNDSRENRSTLARRSSEFDSRLTEPRELPPCRVGTIIMDGIVVTREIVVM